MQKTRLQTLQDEIHSARLAQFRWGGDAGLNDCGYRIRKLTPKECFRLMGFSDEDFYAAKTGSREKAREIISNFHGDLEQSTEAERLSAMSNSQLYKQAGNSIVTDVLYYIYKNLYAAMPNLFANMKVGSFFSGIGAFEIALDRLFDEIKHSDQKETEIGGGV